MNAGGEEELVIPVIAEELHVDAVPVSTGGVRIIKRVVGNEQLIEQELRRERVEVTRERIGREVDGPQQPRQSGATLIIPVVEEILRIERRWVLTEEVHITRVEETRPYQERVIVNHEEVSVERFGTPEGGT